MAVEPKQRDTVKYEASGQAVKGGLWSHDAPVIPAGEYSGTLAMKEARFYQVAVRKGQELRAIGTIKKTPLVTRATIEAPINQDFVVTIYSPGLEVVAREEAKTKDNPRHPSHCAQHGRLKTMALPTLHRRVRKLRRLESR